MHSEPKSIWGMSGFWLSHTVVVLYFVMGASKHT
jgi:hypothetical protein